MTGYEVIMESRKETANKLVWHARLSDADFSLYVPKSCVPEPWPGRIRVTIAMIPGDDPTELRAPRVDRLEPIQAVVDFGEPKTKTVRCRPRGAPTEWEIGEPYIPIEVFERLADSIPANVPVALKLTVAWDSTTPFLGTH